MKPLIRASVSCAALVAAAARFARNHIRPAAILAVAVVLAAAGFQLLGTADVPNVPTDTWTLGSVLTEARADGAAVRLDDDRVLLIGGNGVDGPVSSVEVFEIDGSLSPAAAMNEARSGAAAVRLSDGRVLVTGGSTTLDGVTSITSTTEIYDPASNLWSDAGAMIVPRAGHTASALPDGRVVIAGGSSEPFFSLEVYDPATELFTFAGSATLARSGHAAAVLGDGRVLFVGGTVDGVPTRAADIYDPEAGSLIVAPDMQVARTGHTATSLLGGKQVLITGGHDGISDLASAELFTVADEQFTLVSSELAVPRRGHAAFLLPNNNAVLIVGGWSVGAGVGATELFQPWAGQFTVAAPREFGLSGLTGSGTVKDGVFLVAGGANETGVYSGVDLYGFATVKTDKDDYAPGETVVITGTGWQPGETVTLLLQEDVSPPFHEDFTLFATADENGAIINTEYSPEEHDIGLMFYLTATGAGAQAQNHFWDSAPPAPPPLAAALGLESAGPAEATTANYTPALTVVKTVDLTAISAPGPLTYTITVENTGDVNLTSVVLSDDLTGGATLISGDLTNGLPPPNGVLETTETWVYTATYVATTTDIKVGVTLVNTASVVTDQVPGPTTDDARTTISPFATGGSGVLLAGDYVMFAQARDGNARETGNNGGNESNDEQVSVSGSNNSLFGRIRSNADFSSSGQNNYFHYEGNGPDEPDPDTGPSPPVNDGKVTFRFELADGDNHYENPLNQGNHPNGDPRFLAPLFTGGTWEPVQSDVPVGPVEVVPTTGNPPSPADAPYQYWPGNLHNAVTAASNYLEMNHIALQPFCGDGDPTTEEDPDDFGELDGPGSSRDFDLDESSPNGVYCTNGGKITLSVSDVGDDEDDPKEFTLLANGGLIEISGQNATFKPFALGILAMSDMESSDEQFPIKFSGSNLSIPSQAVVFASRAGVNVSGSEESVLCIQVVGQETQVSGSTSGFGLRSPGCELLGEGTVFGHVFEDKNGDGDQDLGEDGLEGVDVVITDALLGTQTVTTDENGDYSAVVPAGSTTADVDEGPIGGLPDRLLPAFLTAGVDPSTVFVPAFSDTDLGDDGYGPNPELTVVKDVDLTVISVPGTLTYTITVDNTGNVDLTTVVLSDALTGGATLISGDLQPNGILEKTETWTYTATYAATQTDIDAGVVVNTASVVTDQVAGPTEDDATTTVTQEPELTVVKTVVSVLSDATEPFFAFDAVGDVINYSYLVTNTGNVTISEPITIDDDIATDEACPAVPASLAPLDTITCTASHTITQADLDAGEVINVASARGQDPNDQLVTSLTDTATVPAVQEPSLNIVKTAVAGQVADFAGEVITYVITVENTGNLTLTGVTVEDTFAVIVRIGDDPGNNDNDLDVGEIWSYTASHTVTQAEIDTDGGGDGTLENTATADSLQTGEDTDDASVTVVQTRTLAIAKTAAPDPVATVGETISYTLTVTNAGTAAIDGVAVSDAFTDDEAAVVDENDFNVGDSDTDGLLDVGESWSYTASHAVTQDDLDAPGDKIDNVATATGDGATPATDGASVTRAQRTLAIAKTAAPATVATVGETISYTLTVTNDGNAAIAGVAVSDAFTDDEAPVLDGGFNVGDLDDDGLLDVGESWSYTASHVVTQAELDAGGTIDNTATATGDNATPATDSVTVPTVGIDIVKSSDATGTNVVGDEITYTFTVDNTGNVDLTNVVLSDTVTSGATLDEDTDLDDDGELDVDETWVYTATHTLTQEDFDNAPPPVDVLGTEGYVLFAQARVGTAGELSEFGNGSNDAQASVSGSGNSMWGRIRSNADLSTSGSNNNFHFEGNVNPVDDKVTFRLENVDGGNDFTTALSDGPNYLAFTHGTGEPVQEDFPVGPVTPVLTVPAVDQYQYWPGNLHTAVTGPFDSNASDYLEMDTAFLEPFCGDGDPETVDPASFGSLIGGSSDIDLDENSDNGVYCTNGGKITLSASNVDDKRFTLLAKDGIILISGQNSGLEPFTLGTLAMSDLDSGSEQWPIQFSGSDFTIANPGLLFASRAGVKFSGSGGSTCVQAVGQEVAFQTSMGSYGPINPDCIPVERILTNTATVTADPLLGLSVADTDEHDVIFFPAGSNPLRVAGGAIDGGMTAAELTPAMLQAAVAGSIDYWRAAGMAEGRLSAVRQMDVRIADLPGPFLGFAYPGNSIVIDRNAAGHGWSVGSGADGGVDLHDAVAHEVGHLLGLDHDDGGVMRAVLAPGERARHGP